jgi:hypothetical protein
MLHTQSAEISAAVMLTNQRSASDLGAVRNSGASAD